MNDYEKMTNEQMTGDSVSEMPVTENAGGMYAGDMASGTTASRDVVAPAKKKKTPVIIAAVVGVVLVAVIAIVIGIFSGAFMSKKDKVLLALTNTFKCPSKLLEEYGEMCELVLDSYTMGMEIEVEDNYIEIDCAVTDEDKQISGNIMVTDVPEIDFLAEITDSQVRAQVPSFSDYVFTYDYTEEKTGYIATEMGAETVELLDVMCEMIYSAQTGSSDAEVLADVLKEEYKALEFESAEKKEYWVNGEERKCAAYKTVITEENVVNVLDAIEACYPENYMDAMAKMGEDMGDAFDEMREELEGMEDIEVVFYIYKNKLACILFESDDECVEILFDTEDDDMLDITVLDDGEAVFGLDSAFEDSIESYDFIVEDAEVMSVTYDTESGDIELAVEDEYDSVTMRGKFTCDKDGAVMEFSEMEMYGEAVEMLLAITFTEGATLQELSGEEFDLGNATEDELMEVVMEMSSLMY